ncbi:MAG: hypothetical protein H0W33_11435 [Gammaproteobacteria bacterium]|nr:hypothetical protein [Gammaproteobacteria bacterium]
MAWQALAVTAGMMIAILALIQPLLHWIDRPIYEEHIVLLYWALGVMALYAAATVFHYGIYAHYKDRQIILSHVAALIVFMLAVVALRPLFGVVSVPVSICLAYLLILIWKALTFYRIHFGAPDVTPGSS